MLPRPLAGFKGSYIHGEGKGKGGEGRRGQGEEGREEEGREVEKGKGMGKEGGTGLEGCAVVKIL